MAPLVEEIDTEIFIKTVKSYPEIWDLNSEGYKEKRKRFNAWEDISRFLIEDFEEKEDREKNEIVKRLITKWRNLRDTYCKSEKKRSRSGQKRPYVYAKQLSFLQKTMNLSTPDSPTNESIGPLQDTEHVKYESTPCSAILKASTIPRNRNVEMEISQTNYLDHSIISIEPDEDKSFFDCILPSVRKLDDDQKLEFRAEVLNILKTIKKKSKSSLL